MTTKLGPLPAPKLKPMGHCESAIVHHSCTGAIVLVDFYEDKLILMDSWNSVNEICYGYGDPNLLNKLEGHFGSPNHVLQLHRKRFNEDK